MTSPKLAGSRKRTYGDTFRPEEDDHCGERGRGGWERHHRPSRPRNDFSTSGRVRGGDDSPFASKELKTAGTDSGHYKPHKRAHGDSRRHDNDYCSQRDSKRDRRDSAKDEGGSRLRCELRDRRNSVVAAVASNEVRGTVKVQRDCRDETHCASRDRTETCARTERGASREIKVGKSSNVSNPATVYSRIQAMQASQMNVTDTVSMVEVSDRSEVTVASDAVPRVCRERISPDKRHRDESEYVSKEANDVAELTASLQTCSGEGPSWCTSDARLVHDDINRHTWGAVENSGR
ncbi:hypothetical protein MRX96_007956 [Rhipicephalus microplus]